VADAAHELRSPLTALKLQAQALRRNDETPAEREAGIARLNQGIDRAIRLVEQLLVLAREEAQEGPAAGAATPVDLQDIVKLAVADVLPHANHKDIDLGVAGDLPAQPVQVSGQDEALRILLRNLLDNAVKYTPAAGRVDVSIELQDGQPMLVVQDSGPGIAPEDRGRVFDRFFRANSTAGAGESADSAAFGSGLGLAIVNTIAERHGATLELGTSERLGGLKVEVRFPAASAAA
jgi:two-component system OmpR family sensor kinase